MDGHFSPRSIVLLKLSDYLLKEEPLFLRLSSQFRSSHPSLVFLWLLPNPAGCLREVVVVVVVEKGADALIPGAGEVDYATESTRLGAGSATCELTGCLLGITLY